MVGEIRLFEAVISDERGPVQAPLMSVDGGPLVRVFNPAGRILHVHAIEDMDEWRQAEVMPAARRAAGIGGAA